MKAQHIRRVASFFSICIMLVMIAPVSIGQSLSGTDLSTINVDDLSDQQLLGYMKQAEESGYTQAQLEAFARQRGMPEIQISKLRARISQLRFDSGTVATNDVTTSSTNRENYQFSEEDIFGKLAGVNLQEGLTEEQSKIFGFELFRSDKLNFSPNLNIPTPENYILGPGDGIVIDLWGDTQQFWTLEVSPEGTIRPQGLSPIYINGLTIEKASEKIIDRLSQIYAGLKPVRGENPSIFSQITLGNIRTINVTIVGEVNNPGNYALNSLSTVFTALHAAGGPTENGTFRSVRLMRNNKLKADVDLYDFLVNGIKPNDELLRDGDVIIVRLPEARVEVVGEVRRPGIYEVKEGESFQELLEIAGNFTSKAFKSFISLERNSDRGKEVLNISKDEFHDKHPANGDLIEVLINQEIYSNRVQLEGAVHMAGVYELKTNMTVKSLIEKANGPRGDAYFKRATIYRMNPDFSQQTIAFDLGRVLSGSDEDIALMKEDIVRVSSIYDLREEFYVEITGEVAMAGTYPYIDRMSVEDLILLAGGLTEGASGAKVEISRRNTGGVSNSLSEIITLDIDKNLGVSNRQEVEIKPFDQVFIRRTPNYNLQQQITIEGEISSPGIYAISRKDERISDIIKRAGGLTSYAYPEGAILVRRTEFAERPGDSELNLEKLQELRDKIMADSSVAVNKAREELLLRLDRVIASVDNRSEEEELGIGNQVIRELTEDIVANDSLQTSEGLSEQEPTVLDLPKIMENPGSKYDYIVREGDVISIPGKLETVRIAGEVTSPLNLRYDGSFSFKDYINDAGGFTSNARKGRSYVQYPDGRRRQARRFLFFKFYPKVQPGSTIFVSRKPERAPVNLQSAIAAVGSIATLALVIDRLSN